MKHLLVFLLAIVGVMCAHADGIGNITATLSHNDSITIYQGSGALVNALEAAEEGDAIYLSSGIFSISSIPKRVTIIGAGMEDPNNSSTIDETTINQEFSINLNSNDTPLIIEGINFTSRINLGSVKNIWFKKCALYSLNFQQSYEDLSEGGNVYCYDCNISRLSMCNIGIDMYSLCALYNCVVYCSTENMEWCNNLYKNCVVTGYFGQGDTFIDCIINGGGTDSFYNARNKYLNISNCIVFGGVDLTTSSVENIYELDNWDEFFKEDTFYELNEEDAATYIGSDGTQIGIYGGDYPWTIEPSNPQISKVTVPLKPDVNGILPIQVEIKK